MRSVCRIGDIGTGICNGPGHKADKPITGTIIIGSVNVQAENKGKARMGDLVMCSCGHPATMVIGNFQILVNGMAGCRVGDIFQGNGPIGTIITGAPTVLG